MFFNSKYKRLLREDIIEMIESYIIENNLRINDRLPSELEMCSMWNLNRMTLRSAIKRLTEEGALYVKEGSGIFVGNGKLEFKLQDMKSFTNSIKSIGEELHTEVISFNIIESNKIISKKLHLLLGNKIYELIRLRYINNIPMFLEKSYLDVSKYPNLDNYDFSKYSLYDVLEKLYNINLHSGMEYIDISYVNEHEASLLKIKEGTPVFFLQGVVNDENDMPLEYFESIVRSDKIKYSSQLSC